MSNTEAGRNYFLRLTIFFWAEGGQGGGRLTEPGGETGRHGRPGFARPTEVASVLG